VKLIVTLLVPTTVLVLLLKLFMHTKALVVVLSSSRQVDIN